MKSLGTISLESVGAVKQFERGKHILEKGKSMAGVYCKFTFLLANASGSNVTLSATQKQSMLAGYKATLSYGKNGRRRPYNALPLNKLQRVSRFYVGQDWEGYTSTAGLGATLTNGGTTSCVLWVFLPTSRIWHNAKMRKVFGVGRTQAATMALELKRETDTLPTGVTVSGAVNVEIIPLDMSGPYDRWTYLPEYVERNDTSKRALLPVGRPEYVAEISAAGASTQLTDVTVAVDQEPLYEKFSAYNWYIATKLAIPNIPSEADPSDYETPLLMWTPDQEWMDLPTGEFSLYQDTQTVGTVQLRALIAPVPGDDEIREDLEDAAGAKGRNKPLKAVSLGAVFDIPDLKAKDYPYLPFALFDADDKEFQRYPGLVAGVGDGSKAEPYIPDSVRELAMARIAEHRAKGEEKLAEDVIQNVALAVPGAVQDVRGFAKNGSPIYAQVKAALT